MSVYHITYTPELEEVCLFFDGKCDFSCHGCITKFHPSDCHLAEAPREIKNKTLSKKEVISYIKLLATKKVIFLGLEPTRDSDFLPLAQTLKKQFSTYNILITNGYSYVGDSAIDEICVSIKAVSKGLFRDFTGRSDAERVLENFKRYVDTPSIRVRAESVFIPGYIDAAEIEKIAQFIASVDSSIPYRIDGYIPTSVSSSREADSFSRPTEDQMRGAKAVAERYLQNVSILHYRVKRKHRVERVY